jgi:hypothetical protein
LRKWTFALVAAVSLFGAADPWSKVREMKSGAELRIFKKDAKKPLLATFDEANEERIVVVIKNEQMAIPKDEVDRIDYRPSQPGGRVKAESTATEDSHPQTAGRVPSIRPGPSTSTSSGIMIGSKADFETIYRRPPVLPPAKKE